MTLYSLNKVLWKLKHLKLECFSFILPKGSFQQLENFHQSPERCFSTSSVCVCVCVCMLSHVKLLCDPMNCSSPGSSLHGIFQTRVLEWVAIPFSRGSSRPRDRAHVSCTSCTLFHWGASGTSQPQGQTRLLPTVLEKPDKSYEAIV